MSGAWDRARSSVRMLLRKIPLIVKRPSYRKLPSSMRPKNAHRIVRRRVLLPSLRTLRAASSRRIRSLVLGRGIELVLSCLLRRSRLSFRRSSIRVSPLIENRDSGTECGEVNSTFGLIGFIEWVDSRCNVQWYTLNGSLIGRHSAARKYTVVKSRFW